jgi:hypothetical protein
MNTNSRSSSSFITSVKYVQIKGMHYNEVKFILNVSAKLLPVL